MMPITYELYIYLFKSEPQHPQLYNRETTQNFLTMNTAIDLLFQFLENYVSHALTQEFDKSFLFFKNNKALPRKRHRYVNSYSAFLPVQGFQNVQRGYL
ncbi:hypothetical protein QOZ95_000869 [Paenibacillus brasilensis]|uniref:Uncharacterized protein n=1 Tax=Paenibacillus brasilensis TaxID=128574 RepID=A0ABU0KTL8_9BACL|nr:hypothetical protein [Paenibacillus brasilensis]